MDRKSIIGLVLIFGIFVGYMWWIAPSKEEQAAMKARHDSVVAAYNDSIRMDSLLRAEADSLQQHLRDSILAVNPHADVERLLADNVNTAELRNQLGVFASNVADRTDSLTVTNRVFQVVLSDKGAAVCKVTLSDYSTYDSLPLVLISPSPDNMNLVFSTNDNRVINTKDLSFSPFVDGLPWNADRELRVEDDSLVVAFRAYATANAALSDSSVEDVADLSHYVEFRYTFYPERYDVDFSIEFHGMSGLIRPTPYMDFAWHNRMNRQEKVDQSSRGSRNRNKDAEKFNSNVYYKPTKDKVDNLRLGSDDSKQVKTPVEWVAFKQQFFCAILMSDTPFENADLYNSTNRQDTARNYLCDMGGTIGLAYDSEQDCSIDMRFYFGPSKYKDLRDMHRGFERMLPLGWGFFLIQWTSRLLIVGFRFFAGFIGNYGIIIILLTLLLRLLLFPLTSSTCTGYTNFICIHL